MHGKWIVLQPELTPDMLAENMLPWSRWEKMPAWLGVVA